MTAQPSMRQVWAWRLRAWQFGRCATVGELIARNGLPARRLEAHGLGLWQYALQILDGRVHSIYVAVAGDRPVGAFYHVDRMVPPTAEAPHVAVAGTAPSAPVEAAVADAAAAHPAWAGLDDGVALPQRN